MPLSVATILPKSVAHPISFSTNILIVGGAYGGLSALNAFVNNFKEKSVVHKKFGKNNKLSVTLIEPRAGLLNVIGMPRCIVDEEFSKTQFIPYDKIKNLKFDNTVTYDAKLIGDFSVDSYKSDNHEHGLDVTYVQGKVSYLDENKAQYQLVKEDGFDEVNEAMVDFDYVILASGRDRNWPTTPRAFSLGYFIDEMKASKESLAGHDIISVIGGGAVGVELAGDFKHFMPEKTINLIHPHGFLPPEPSLTDHFKSLTLDSLEQSGVNVILNTRIQTDRNDINKGVTFGDLTTKDHRIIPSHLNIWCTVHQNNTSFLSSTLKQKYLTDKNCIKVNEYLQLSDNNDIVTNFFVLGDLVDLPIIKSAGWALYHGRQIANNLSSLILEDKFVEPHPEPSQVPKGMVLVAGDGELICQLAGEVSKNVPEFVEEYKDYCFGKVAATIGV